MIRELNVQELAQKLASDEPVHLLDVRQPWEHEIAALPGSQLVPLAELPARIAEIAPAPRALLVVYCHHGIRSLHAAGFLERAGFPAVASLAGGIDAWALHVDGKVPRY